MKLAIIIPAYNEEKRIGRTLDLYLKYFNSLTKKENLNYKIIIVINNSKDQTLDIVKRYSTKNKKLEYLNLVKGGKGYAVTEGFKHALKDGYDLIGFVDADAATPPQAFHLMVKKINKYDGVIASRYVPGSIISPKPSIQRWISSRIYNLLIRALFLMPYRDTQCGAKLFKRNALERTIPLLTMSHWAFDIDFLYHLRKGGFKIAEVPTIWRDQQYSTINFLKAGPFMALAIIRLRIIFSPFKRFVKIYDKFNSLIK